jgi:hypothetical protein
MPVTIKQGNSFFDYAGTGQNSASGTELNDVQAFTALLPGLPAIQPVVCRTDSSEYSKTIGFFAYNTSVFDL